MGWENWSAVHNEPDQVTRQKSAAKAACTPLSISDGIGNFQGSHGQYVATLDNCQCVDFVRRKLPCKHMYRLAIELGVFSSGGAVKSDPHAISIPIAQHEKMLTDFVALLENYSFEEQLVLKEVICDLTYRNSNESFAHLSPLLSEIAETGLLLFEKKYDAFPHHYRKRDVLSMIETAGIVIPATEKTQKAKIQWVCDRLDVYGETLFPNDVIITMPSGMNTIGRHLYKYLHRKLDEEFKWTAPDDDDGNAVMPDDVATKVLDLFGTTPDLP